MIAQPTKQSLVERLTIKTLENVDCAFESRSNKEIAKVVGKKMLGFYLLPVLGDIVMHNVYEHHREFGRKHNLNNDWKFNLSEVACIAAKYILYADAAIILYNHLT